MQQDQIRAGRLFILVNTTPRIYLKFKTRNTGHFNTMGSIHQQCNSGLFSPNTVLQFSKVC